MSPILKMVHYLLSYISYTARIRIICFLGILTIGVILYAVYFVQAPFVQVYQIKLAGIEQNLRLNSMLEKSSEIELLMRESSESSREYKQRLAPYVLEIDGKLHLAKKQLHEQMHGKIFINHEMQEQVEQLLNTMVQQWQGIFNTWETGQRLTIEQMLTFTRPLLGVINYVVQMYGLDLDSNLANYFINDISTMRFPVVLMFLSEIESRLKMSGNQEAFFKILVPAVKEEMSQVMAEITSSFESLPELLREDFLNISNRVEAFQRVLQDYLNGIETNSLGVNGDAIVRQGWEIEHDMLTMFKRTQEWSLMTLRQRQNFATIVSGVLAAVFLLMYFTRLIRGPVEVLKKAAQDLVAGNLSVRVPISAKDEVGDIAKAFNRIAALWEKSIVQVKAISERLVENSTSIFETAKRLESNVDYQEVVIGKIELQMKEIALTAEKFATVLQKVNKGTEVTSALAVKGTDSLTEMSAIMQQMIEASKQIVNILDVIREQVDRIHGVIVSIVEVADQSNLLSINTAIKASRSGNTVKGFVVVADNIRELADQTAFATLDLEQAVQEIVAVMSNAVADVDKFSSQITSQVADEKIVNEQLRARILQTQEQIQSFEQINAGMREQWNESKPIFPLLTNLSEVTDQTDKTVRKLYRDAEFLYRGTQDLSKVLEAFHVQSKG